MNTISTRAGLFQVFAIALSKFEKSTVGTRVKLGLTQFVQEFAGEALAKHDHSANRAPGQCFIFLDATPETLNILFDAGVGRRTTNPSDYFPALWRGEVLLLGRRSLALPVTGAACIIYSREAFLADPDLTEEERRWLDPETQWVLVDVLAFSGPKGELSPGRFVRNMAGENNAHMQASADELRAEAVRVAAYDNEYVTVGD